MDKCNVEFLCSSNSCGVCEACIFHEALWKTEKEVKEAEIRKARRAKELSKVDKYILESRIGLLAGKYDEIKVEFESVKRFPFGDHWDTERKNQGDSRTIPFAAIVKIVEFLGNDGHLALGISKNWREAFIYRTDFWRPTQKQTIDIINKSSLGQTINLLPPNLYCSFHEEFFEKLLGSYKSYIRDIFLTAGKILSPSKTGEDFVPFALTILPFSGSFMDGGSFSSHLGKFKDWKITEEEISQNIKKQTSLCKYLFPGKRFKPDELKPLSLFCLILSRAYDTEFTRDSLESLLSLEEITDLTEEEELHDLLGIEYDHCIYSRFKKIEAVAFSDQESDNEKYITLTTKNNSFSYRFPEFHKLNKYNHTSLFLFDKEFIDIFIDTIFHHQLKGVKKSAKITSPAIIKLISQDVGEITRTLRCVRTRCSNKGIDFEQKYGHWAFHSNLITQNRDKKDPFLLRDIFDFYHMFPTLNVNFLKEPLLSNTKTLSVVNFLREERMFYGLVYEIKGYYKRDDDEKYDDSNYRDLVFGKKSTNV